MFIDWTFHSVCFSWTSLSECKNTNILSIQSCLNKRFDFIEYIWLRLFWQKYLIKVMQTLMIFLFWIYKLNCLMNHIFQFVLKLFLWKTNRCFHIFFFFVKWVLTHGTTWFWTYWIKIFDSTKHSHVSFQINNLLHLLFPYWF